MSVREDCRDCGHDKSSHHPEPEVTGDEVNPGRPGFVHYGACLGLWCNCPRYREKKP